MKIHVMKAMQVLIAIGLAFALPVEAYGAVDLLDLPAAMSARASSELMLSVTRAGSRLVAVGDHGIVVYSDDKGMNWKQARVPVSVTLTAVTFPTATTGWAVGHDGVVLSSSDSGLSWVKRFDGNVANSLMLKEAQERAKLHPSADAENALADVQAGIKFGPSRPLLGVWFKNEWDGIVVGSYGQIFHTGDGGLHWESLALRVHNPEGLHYNAIGSTASGAIVIAGEGGKVYRSADQGATWQTLDTGYQGQLYGVLGLHADQGREKLLAFGFGGHIFQSDPDGTHWSELSRVTQKNLVAGMSMEDGQLILIGQDGSILRSDQEVKRFDLIKSGNGLAIAGAVQLANQDQFILSGTGGLHPVSAASNHAGKPTP